MFLAQQDARRAMSEPTQKAFEQLWALQRTEAPAKGAWKWYAANLDPGSTPVELLRRIARDVGAWGDVR